MINAARLLFGAVPLHPCHQSLDAFEATRDDNTQTSGIASTPGIPACPVAGRSRRRLSAGAPISAYWMIRVSMPGMITLGADIPASHPARIGINAGERLSDFALIVLAFDSNRGEIKIVPGLMLAASSSPG